MENAGGPGRPRSEAARTAVLHAVDDLLVDVGYAAMTMKGIAQRAGVGRQTVYRWWNTKAEILLEAVVGDAQQELAITPTDDTGDLTDYLTALTVFLTTSPAGAGYRALLGEAQHDSTVAELISRHDVLFDSATAVLTRIAPRADTSQILCAAAALVGPVIAWILTGREPDQLFTAPIVAACLAALDPPVPAPRAARPTSQHQR